MKTNSHKIKSGYLPENRTFMSKVGVNVWFSAILRLGLMPIYGVCPCICYFINKSKFVPPLNVWAKRRKKIRVLSHCSPGVSLVHYQVL